MRVLEGYVQCGLCMRPAEFYIATVRRGDGSDVRCEYFCDGQRATEARWRGYRGYMHRVRYRWLIGGSGAGKGGWERRAGRAEEDAATKAVHKFIGFIGQ